MQIIESAEELRQAISTARAGGKRVGFVPTMGALHRGHLSLVAAAKRECDCVVVSIFVNPTQFGPGEDFEKYPRPLEADTKQLAKEAVDIVFTPNKETMYPAGAVTWVEVEGPLTESLEAAHRQQHFRGVTTVVATLFHVVGPDVAYFGQKDYQQSVIIRRMTDDLRFPINIQVCPTVRDPDGLALSSRNQYLDEAQRQQALALSKGLFAARQLFDSGERSAKGLRSAVKSVFAEHPDVEIDYIEVVQPDSLAPIEGQIGEQAAVLVAARVGKTRLIDNLTLTAK